MNATNITGLREVNIHHLREYILEVVHELALVADRKGDYSVARALQACGGQIRDAEGHEVA